MNDHWMPCRKLLELCATTEQFANPSEIGRVTSNRNGKLLDGLGLMWVGGNNTSAFRGPNGPLLHKSRYYHNLRG